MSRRRVLARYMVWARYVDKIESTVGHISEMAPSNGWGRAIGAMFREERKRHKRRLGRMS